jgi:phosphoglycerate dehydrogenase-like enzyme
MPRCVILDDYQNAAMKSADWSRLKGKVDLHVSHDPILDREALVYKLADAEIIVAMRERTPFDKELFERLPKLKLLVTTGMRNAAIDLKAAADHDVTVCGTEGSVGATAELAFGLILALMRNIPCESALFRSGGKWQTTVGRELNSRKLGIIGLGKLGARLAKFGLAFGMQVSAWSQNLTAEKCAEAGVEFAGSLDNLLKTSDVISIHLVLSDRTRGLIGAKQFAMMKPDTVLVNTSRGPIIDETALIDALKSKKIAGAGLDVFNEEPLPSSHPLRGLDNVIGLPHLGYVTEETYRIFYGQAVEDIAGWLDGKPLRILKA